MVMPHQPAKRLGELFIEHRMITPAQLERALEEQRATKEFLGAVLVRLGFIRPDALLETLSEQFHLPHEPLTVERVDWAAVKQFPASVCSEGKCFPIRADAESVTVAIANPLEVWALSAVEKAAGFRKIKAVLVLEHELQAVLQAYRQQSLKAIAAHFDDHADPKTQ